MANIPSTQLNKSTSFHSIALSFSYIGALILFHFVTPYIHELVYSFFNGLFLILSIILFFYFNVLLRTSSITYFSYASLAFRITISVVFLALSIIARAITDGLNPTNSKCLCITISEIFSTCCFTFLFSSSVSVIWS